MATPIPIPDPPPPTHLPCGPPGVPPAESRERRSPRPSIKVRRRTPVASDLSSALSIYGGPILGGWLGLILKPGCGRVDFCLCLVTNWSSLQCGREGMPRPLPPHTGAAVTSSVAPRTRSRAVIRAFQITVGRRGNGVPRICPRTPAFVHWLICPPRDVVIFLCFAPLVV